MRGDVLEGLGDLVAFLQPALRLVEFGLEPAELHRDLGLLLCEQVGTDPIGVVQVEQLATLLLEIGHECVGPVRTPAGACPGRLAQLSSNRFLQPLIPAYKPQTEQCRSFDPEHRTPRLSAALAAVDTAKGPPPVAVAIHSGDPTTQPAPHHSRERIPTLATPTLDPSPLGTLRIGLTD